MPLFFQCIYDEIIRYSSLNPLEMVSIIGSYHNVGSKKEIDRSKYSEAQIKAMESAERFTPITSLGVRINRPLKHFQCPQFNYYMILWGQYESHGTLPFPGAIVDQPALIMEILNILKALVNEARDIERKKQERKK